MDKKLTLSTDILNASRCSLCNNYLSVPPLIIISDDGRENKCGRCLLIESKMGKRNEALENILRHLYLPCTYGCQHQMSWEEVKNHENECQERTLQCPLYYKDCNSIFTVSKMEDHFIEKHLDNIKYGNVITFDLKDDHSIVLLAIAGDEIFFIYLFAYTDFFSFNVFSIQPSQKYTKYHLTISSGDNKACIIYKNCNIQRFNERLHCNRCMESECHLDYHPYAEKYNKPETNRTQFAEMNREAIRELLESPVSLKFTIQLLGEDEIEKTVRKHKLLRKCFECSKCCSFMLKPIYLCKAGHSICDGCKLRLDKCPNCETEIDGARNFTLEDMTENVKLPCRYEEQGCTYAGNVESLCKHELTCEYKLED